jgi:hypothetical protein
MRSNKSKRVTRAFGTPALAVVVVCVAAAAILVAARQPSQPADITAADLTAVETQPQQPEATQPTPNKMPPARVQPKRATALAAAPAAASKPVEPAPEAVTITGCLEELKDQTFQLRDTAGVDAPKSRSWKSGFLKKNANSIDLVDPANRMKLSSHVGQRVSVTGMLDDREMRVRSLQRVAESCD